MKLYISGPMTGLPEYNYPKFNRMADTIRLAGHEPINPAENFGGSTDHPEGRKAYMRLDFMHVLNSDGLVMLDGWEKSRGACIEKEIAHELELPIFGENLEPLKQENILEEANRIIHGQRQASYGHPKVDFTRTAKLWDAIINHGEVTALKVGMCMIALKMSRLCNAFKRDSIVDIAGYAGTLEMLDE